MNPTTRFWLTTAITSVALIGIGLYVVVKSIPEDTIKKQVEQQVEKATGRQLTLNGPISLHIFPKISLSAQDVTLGNPKNFTIKNAPPLLRLKQMDVELQLFPLLRKEVKMEAFLLEHPEIYLAIDKKGKANWDFATETNKTEKSNTEKQKEPASAPMVTLPEMQLRNGQVTYLADAHAKPITISKLNANLLLPGMDQKMMLKSDGVYQNKLSFRLDAQVLSPASWLAGQATEFTLDVALEQGNANIQTQGTAMPSAVGLDYDGTVTVNVDSLKKLGAAMDMALLPEQAPASGKLAFHSAVIFKDNHLALKNMAVSLDDIALAGTIDATLAGKKPAINLALTSEKRLVLDKWMGGKDTAKSAPAGGQAAPVAAGYSKEPILADLSALNQANVEVKFDAQGGLQAQEIAFAPFTTMLSVKNGLANLSIPSLALYGGTAKLDITLSGAKTPLLQQRITLSGVDIAQLLETTSGESKLEGKADISLNTKTRGVSVYDFVHHLNGGGNIMVRDGAFRGINLAQFVRDAKNLLKPMQQTAQEGKNVPKTDFSELSASISIVNGVVHNQDLSMKAPLLTLTGAGQVDLPQSRVDYRVKPTLVTTIQGQNREEDAKRVVTIPVKVSGPFDGLTFSIDAASLINDVAKDPEKAVQKAKDAIESIKEIKKDKGQLKEGLKSLLNGL